MLVYPLYSRDNAENEQTPTKQGAVRIIHNCERPQQGRPMASGEDPNAWLGLLKWSLSHQDGTEPSGARPMADEVCFTHEMAVQLLSRMN